MYAWEHIQKTLDYIEDNIGSEIEIEVLANIASLSFFYYHRLFSRLVGKPVREYIKLRRLARVYESLADKDKRIIDIALDHGFSSHETFTRAFKDAYGLTPSEFRNNPVALNNFQKPDLLLNYVIVDEGMPLVSDGIVLEMNRRVLNEPLYFLGLVGHINKSSQVPLGTVVGVSEASTVWERFEQEVHKINRKPGGRGFGVSFRGDAPKGYFSYFVGTEVDEGNREENRNEEFRLWKLPPQAYVVCGFEAENFETLVNSALGKGMNYIDWWIKKHGLEPISFMTEHYIGKSDAAYMELWQPIKKVV